MGASGVAGVLLGVEGESPRFLRRLARDSALDFSRARFFARRASSSSFAWARRAARAACAVARERERARRWRWCGREKTCIGEVGCVARVVARSVQEEGGDVRSRAPGSARGMASQAKQSGWGASELKRQCRCECDECERVGGIAAVSLVKVEPVKVSILTLAPPPRGVRGVDGAFSSSCNPPRPFSSGAAGLATPAPPLLSAASAGVALAPLVLALLSATSAAPAASTDAAAREPGAAMRPKEGGGVGDPTIGETPIGAIWRMAGCESVTKPVPTVVGAPKCRPVNILRSRERGRGGACGPCGATTPRGRGRARTNRKRPWSVEAEIVRCMDKK